MSVRKRLVGSHTAQREEDREHWGWWEGKDPTCSVVLTVTTSLSQGGNLLMVLVRKDTMVSP